jgi:hypothetical protein
MSISLDGNGDINIDPVTGLSMQVTDLQSLEEQAMSECRCEEQGWFADDTYGRNPLVWKLPTTDNDKVADIKRIVTKYYQPSSISASADGLFIVNQ